MYLNQVKDTWKEYFRLTRNDYWYTMSTTGYFSSRYGYQENTSHLMFRFNILDKKDNETIMDINYNKKVEKFLSDIKYLGI